MAEDCIDGDYLGEYSRFFTEFIARVKPHDQLPVSVSSYNVTKAEMVGEIINVTLQYLNKTQCPASLQAHLVHQVVQEIESMCIKQPKDCGFKSEEKTYTSLRLMQAVIAKVNEVCTRYLDNSRLALLPPPPCWPLPQVAAGGNKNSRRTMEDRYVVLHDLHSTFGIQDESIVNYYAVFDGHAGQDAAVYCATHLHQYLTESIYYPANPEGALHDAFVITDKQFEEKHKTQKVCGGTTAVCTLIMNKRLYVAWVGDSPAILIKRDSIVQLINPHKLHREDERQRIEKMGGVVIHSMGTLRVNGELCVSRAIGDVLYKPYVTGSPEVNCVKLDGTEDFLVLATDGLTDFVEAAEISTILYHEIRRNPNAGLKRAHHILLQWAKYAGSKDNVTVIVVLLTPANEIAARTRYLHPYHLPEVNDILEEMNSKDKPVQRDIEYAHNAIKSNVIKQTMIGQDQDGDILEASNGKHENGDADYDYSDLGPETNVDAIDDAPTTMPVKNLSYEFYQNDHDDDHARDKDSNLMDDLDVDESADVARRSFIDNNLHERDEIMAQQGIPERIEEELREEISNEVRKSFEENLEREEASMKEEQQDDSRDTVDEAGPIDYDSPPSPQANKPLQHALIQEADNVADSEDSEDEWNYYRVDPNKGKDTAAPAEETDSPKVAVEEETNIHSEESEEDVKCEGPIKDSPELINTEISAEEDREKLSEEEEDKSKAMDFPLNPDAAEFIPGSPQFTGAPMNLADFPVSGSPFKQVSQMDDIQVPTQSEFEKEVCQRPREVESEDKEYQNGDHVQPNTDLADYMNDRQKAASFINTLDDSEISSTKAEYGDTSVSFLTTSEFQKTEISAVDASFTSSERDYDIAKDPMAMSFTPSDFEAAFDNKAVDLNAVHNLSNSDLDEKNGSMEKEEDEEELTSQSPEPQPVVNNVESQEEPVVLEQSTELVNLSSQQEREATFIEHADKVQPVVDFLALRAESSPMEQQESKEDRSPLTENYSGEFESEKEAVSADNEQPPSPSSVDIDETKPIDEASEDAALPASDLPKEISTKETDTPSSLSPIPDVIDSEVLASVDDADIPHAPMECSLHADAPEFTPNERYNYHPFDTENREVCRSPENDVCQTKPSDDVAESCAYQPYSTEACDAFEASQNLQHFSAEIQPEEKEKMVEPVATKATEGNLLDFTEERQEVCAKDQLTPPLSPRRVEENASESLEDLVCPMQPTKPKSEEVEPKEEGPMEADVLETKPEEEIEPAKEAGLNLSASMQEFTGLEKQLQPKAEEVTIEPCVAPEVREEIRKEEEAKEAEPEKAVESIVVEEECKAEEKKEVEEVPSSMQESEIEKAVEAVETTEAAKIEEASENKTKETAAVAAAAVAAAATATQSKGKTKSSAKSTKTPTSKTTTPKSTPTSPSKAAISSPRTSATAKKSATTAATRPKDLDAPKKVSSSAALKTSTPKSASKTTTASAPKPTTRTSSGTTMKPKPAAVSSKTTATEKKATANGDAKPLGKPAPAKPLGKTQSATKTTLVKASSTTRTSTGTTTSKPRPATATTNTKTNTTAKSSTTTTTTASSGRPKTAPSAGSTTKTTARTSLSKNPVIDKQVKETANKQISMARTSTVSKTRVSSSSTTSATAKRASSTKTSTASSPIKKTATTATKVTGKTSSAPKTATEKGKVLQNGMSEKAEVNTIIDDVPKKDLSPVIPPNDNQLIMSSD